MTEQKKLTFRTSSLIYLIINSMFMLPMTVVDKLDTIMIVPPFTLYLVLMCLYFLFFITYAHVVLCAGILIYNVQMFIKDKNIMIFAAALIVIAADIALNIWWAANGRPYTIQ